MSALARRGLLKLIGIAPVAAGSAASRMAPFLESPAVIAATSGLALLKSEGQVGLPQNTYGFLGPILGKELKRLKRQMENEIWVRRNLRQNGLDGDIACFRSTSRTWKERHQTERDNADDALIRHADTVMWGDP